MSANNLYFPQIQPVGSLNTSSFIPVDDKKTGLPRKVPLDKFVNEILRLNLITANSFFTQNQINAVTNSNSPSGTNPFATISDLPVVPTNVSVFTNDSGYLTIGDLPPIENLFTANLTLAANRTHDLNGNSVTFLKSNFEFRAVDALSNTIGFRYRNLANTQNIFSIKNQGRVEINGSDALVLLTGTSYTAYWLNTPTAQMSMFNEGANYVGFRQNTNDLLFQRGGGSASETHTSISVSNGSWNFGLNWASATAMLNVGMGTLNQARLGVQAINGNSSERVLGLRNHTNTGWAFEVRNNLDIIANGGTNNDNITSIGYLSGKLGNANTFYGRSAGQTSSTGEDNTMIGYTAGASCSTGIQNVFIGSSAGNACNGSSNVFIGALSGAFNTGSGNMIISSGFGGAYGTGSQNCFIGSQVALYASSGAENCAIGRASLLSLGTGSQNVAMGQDSGAYRGVGFDSNANPSNSIFLGAYSRANDSNQTNQIVIGHNATGEGSNTARIGNSSVTELHVGGNGAALALKSPDGTTWRISVDNTGTLVVV